MIQLLKKQYTIIWIEKDTKLDLKLDVPDIELILQLSIQHIVGNMFLVLNVMVLPITQQGQPEKEID